MKDTHADTYADLATSEVSDRGITLPPDVTWQRMHPITPLLNGWKVIATIIAYGTYQNADEAYHAWEAIHRDGLPIHHTQLLWIGVATVAVLILGAIWLFLSWRYCLYAVDRDGVYLRTGVLLKQVRAVRLPRVQSVDVVHPLAGRIFGLGQLTVDIVGGNDSRVILRYLRTRQLEGLRDQILTLAAGLDAPSENEHMIVPEDASSHEEAGKQDDYPSTTDRGNAAHGTMPVGFETMNTGPRLQRDSRDEHPLYTVDTRLLLLALLRSVSVILGILFFVIANFAAVLISIFLSSFDDVNIGELLPLITMPLVFAGFLWNQLNSAWNFRAAATPSGIRVRYGLTFDSSTTLPPGRVHAVSLTQGLLWRSKDWWKVSVAVAGRESTSSQETAGTNNVLLPVGHRETALRALWLVTPDLGSPDPDRLLDEVLTGMDDDGVGDRHAPVGSPERGLVRISPRARLFSPLGWRREGIVLTDTCVILRLGRWRRRVSVVPYERIQSIAVTQGPFARRRGVAAIKLCIVTLMQVPASLSNVSVADALAVERVIAERALRRRHNEHLDHWLARANTVADNDGDERPVASSADYAVVQAPESCV